MIWGDLGSGYLIPPHIAQRKKLLTDQGAGVWVLVELTGYVEWTTTDLPKGALTMTCNGRKVLPVGIQYHDGEEKLENWDWLETEPP